MYTSTVQEEAFCNTVKVDEHKGVSEVKERIVVEQQRTRTLKKTDIRKEH